MLIDMQHGRIGCARDISESKPIKRIYQSILSFLEVGTTGFKALDFCGGPHVPISRIEVYLQDEYVCVRVGRYLGTLVNPVHFDGHAMTSREIMAKWNLKSYSSKSERKRRDTVQPAATDAEILGDGSGDDEEPLPVMDKEQERQFLTNAYAKRDRTADTVTRGDLCEVLESLGFIQRQVQIIQEFESKGLLADLTEDGTYGFEDKALDIIGIAKPTLPPPVGEESELMQLMRTADEKLGQRRLLWEKLGVVQNAVKENDAARVELERMHKELGRQAEGIMSEIKKFDTVNAAFEAFRKAIQG